MNYLTCTLRHKLALQLNQKQVKKIEKLLK